MACPMPPLVAVGIRDNADPIALFQGILDQPFEGAPIGVHLHRALDAHVMRHLDVGVTPADMGDHHAILVLQRLEQVVGAVGIGGHVGQIVDQRMEERWICRPSCMNMTLRSPPRPVLPDHS